jgi:tetratricopeptide (TPR) repeat protein
MLNFINSYRAHRNWVKAHAEMAGQFQSFALTSIRKAVELEPKKALIPKYLELQGHIESNIGKIDQAFKSFQRAIEIIRDNPKSIFSPEMAELEKRLIKALEELNNKAET